MGYAELSPKSLHGFGGGAHLTYGMTDAFNALVELDFTAHPSGDTLVASGAVGAAYVFDVLEWVPYIGLMGGAYEVISTSQACGLASARASGSASFSEMKLTSMTTRSTGSAISALLRWRALTRS